MNHLSLFAGGGGTEYAARLLGWHTVGYVEFEDYPQRIIAARIADGTFPEAPIFGDIRAFISEGYAASYSGLVDIISGGFPCQPFSAAGKQLGADDERNMWPATVECVRIVRPRFVFLENVAALSTSDYAGTIHADLAKIGYDTQWICLPAASVGAPHKRERWWCLATDANGAGCQTRRGNRMGEKQPSKRFACSGGNVPDASRTRRGTPYAVQPGRDLDRHDTPRQQGGRSITRELVADREHVAYA